MEPISPSKRPFWKGKGKNTDSNDVDTDQLNPTITYRHLHSHALGVRDPLRVIALCDSDAFYAACEMVRLKTDPEIPLVVQQWDSLIAVNYPARKFGISRMDRVKDAKKKCPELMCVHVATFKEGEGEPGYWGEVDSRTHKVALDPYRKESVKILNIFKEGLANAEIEKASIDEAFFDLTRPVRDAILQRYPHLASIPTTGPDTPLPRPPPIQWDGLGHLIPINPSSSDTPTETGQASNEPPHTEPPCTWHDLALSIGAELMFKIREEVRTSLGYTTSAGIARNKFLAKLSASYKKPNGQTILRNAAIPDYLNAMPFQKIRFLGGKLGKAIAEEYDVSAVGDLLSISVEEMQNNFGESAIWVWEVLRGIDRSEVKAKPPLPKSMLSAKNLLDPITKPSQGKHWIRVLATDLAHRLKEARQEHPTLWPKTIALGAYKNYQNGRSKQAPFPFVRDVTIDVIAAAGDKLWKELMGSTDESTLKITHIYLRFSGVGTAESGQGSIQGFLKSPGMMSVPTMGKRNREKTSGGISDDEDDDALPYANGVPDRHFGDSSNTSRLVATSGGEHQSDMSFTCGRCGKKLSLQRDGHVAIDGSSGDQDVKVDLKLKLDVLRREHEDYHFALDLTRQTHGSLKVETTASSSSTRSSRKKRKTEGQKQNKAAGIERFFHAK